MTDTRLRKTRGTTNNNKQKDGALLDPFVQQEKQKVANSVKTAKDGPIFVLIKSKEAYVNNIYISI